MTEVMNSFGLKAEEQILYYIVFKKDGVIHRGTLNIGKVHSCTYESSQPPPEVFTDEQEYLDRLTELNIEL